MAILKFINGKNKKKAGLIRAIDYIADKEKTETIDVNREDGESLFINDLLVYNKGDRAINYITKDDKTELSLITGINCSPVSAFEEMMITKKCIIKKKADNLYISLIHIQIKKR